MKSLPHLRRLALAGLLGLGCAGAVLAADRGCSEDSSGSAAIKIALCNGGFGDLQRLAAIYQERLGLPADVAGGLAETLAKCQALEARRDQAEVVPEAEVRQVESEFIILLDRAPGSKSIADELAWFYVSREWGGWAPAPALLDRVARSADPVGLAERLAEHDDWRPGTEIRLAALAVRPGAAALWQRVSFDVFQPSWRSAFREEAYRQVAAGTAGRPASPDLITAVAEAWLAAELDAGLDAPAVAAFEGMPPALRSRILRGDAGNVKGEAGGLPLEERMRDLRLPLAAAYLLTGEPKTAAGIIARLVPPSAAEQEKDPTLKAEEAARQAMLRWLHPAADDPFDLLTALLAASATSPGAGIGGRLQARLAEREGYPAIGAYLVKGLAENAGLDGGGFEPGGRVPARVRASAAALQGEIAKLRQGLADEVSADREAARETLGPDPAAATMDRLLRAPAVVRFTEKPLPAGIRPLELERQEVERRQQAMAAEVELPAGFGMIRAERQGERAVAIGVSQDLDPVGEVSAGAYWVILSSDGGRSWDPPLYTGLRVNQPWVVRAVSDLPLLADGPLRHLQIEVEIAEIDDTRITFPPIGLATKRTAKGLYLDIPLELLEQDSDGDGLTDLVEERLLTDPASRDTDGDGLEDAVDPLPAIPYQRAAPTARARALAAFVAGLWKDGTGALIEGVSGGPQPLGGVVGTSGGSPLAPKTLYLVADRALFATLSPGRRVVVLNDEEMAAAEKRFGSFFPARLELFVFDRSGRRAYAVWSASWEGGQTLLEENADGSWKASRTTGWIT
jgi:hypothetical protein